MSTNETIEAIIVGLDIKPNDYIIAICGSGDQPLAMLEYARKVLAVDFTISQIEFTFEQINLIKKGDYDGFLSNRGRGNDAYFTKERLDCIREKLPNLGIMKGDILKACTSEIGFNKAYLSNILDNPVERNTFNLLKRDLSVVNMNIPNGGLVYVTDGYLLRKRFLNKNYTLKNGRLEKFTNNTGLTIDKELSILANELETSHLSWKPLVLKKVGEPSKIPTNHPSPDSTTKLYNLNNSQ